MDWIPISELSPPRDERVILWLVSITEPSTTYWSEGRWAEHALLLLNPEGCWRKPEDEGWQITHWMLVDPPGTTSEDTDGSDWDKPSE